MNKESFYSRTMHTPDDPDRARVRESLRGVSRALIPLHRALINAARDDYAMMMRPISGPNELLRLVQEDPFFAWLQPMTKLIVDIDEMARTDFTDTDIAGVAERLGQLFDASRDAAFAEQYVPILQRDVDVAAGHAALKRALASLLNEA